MAKFRKRASRAFRYAKRTSRKAGNSAILSDVVAGAAVGVALPFVAPYVNRFVPSIAGVQPTTIALLGAGVAGKYMRKGGKFADAALILGSAMLAQNMVGGLGGSSSNGSYSI
jgi:hypothetical protein